MPPNSIIDGTFADQVYAIPPDAISGRQVEIAIRVRHWPGWERASCRGADLRAGGRHYSSLTDPSGWSAWTGTTLIGLMTSQSVVPSRIVNL
jgi:hypothetical protein